MVYSPNGLKYVKPACGGLGKAVDGRFRVGVPRGGNLVGLIDSRCGDVWSLAADAVAIAAAVLGAVGGSVGQRR